MKKEQSSRLVLTPKILLGFLLCCGACIGTAMLAQADQTSSGVQVGHSYHNDVSPALRDLPTMWPPKPLKEIEFREANLNPQLPLIDHIDGPDPVIDHGVLGQLLPEVMPAPILNFDGIPFPGVVCGCAPPDTNGAVG